MSATLLNEYGMVYSKDSVTLSCAFTPKRLTKKELVRFLKEFEGFTDLISTSGCTTRTSYWTFVVQPTRVV